MLDIVLQPHAKPEEVPRADSHHGIHTKVFAHHCADFANCVPTQREIVNKDANLQQQILANKYVLSHQRERNSAMPPAGALNAANTRHSRTQHEPSNPRTEIERQLNHQWTSLPEPIHPMRKAYQMHQIQSHPTTYQCDKVS